MEGGARLGTAVAFHRAVPPRAAFQPANLAKNFESEPLSALQKADGHAGRANRWALGWALVADWSVQHVVHSVRLGYSDAATNCVGKASSSPVLFPAGAIIAVLLLAAAFP